jgi:hypothetical protein
MKITGLEEFADFATIDTEKLFSNLMNCLENVVLIMMLPSLVRL